MKCDFEKNVPKTSIVSGIIVIPLPRRAKERKQKINCTGGIIFDQAPP